MIVAEQVGSYKRANFVKFEKFSEILQRTLNAYLNGLLTNEQVMADELAFYDALLGVKCRIRRVGELKLIIYINILKIF